MAQAVQNDIAAGASAYQKPASGIPAADLASGVQASLDKADTALQSVPDLSAAYVTVAQGAANAGKFLVVGSSGSVALMTLAAWQGGSY